MVRNKKIDSLQTNWVAGWATHLQSLRLRKSITSRFTHHNIRVWKMFVSYINKNNITAKMRIRELNKADLISSNLKVTYVDTWKPPKHCETVNP